MLEVRLIGTFDIQRDGKPVTISSRAAQSLFAYLILTAGTLHRREKLAGIFWPDATEEKARAYLRHELWLIRKTLFTSSKVEYLFADDINISFNASIEHWLDAAALKGLSESASTEELMRGLLLFQGEILPGFYDDWVTQEREHLQAVYEQKMAQLLELLESEKRWNEILEWAEHWISFGQGSEAAYRYLMISYDALGDRAKVASTYQRCVQVLRELDLEPSEQTRALAFKRTSKLNIPIPLTNFIGREQDLKEVANLLSKSRLVTLTGSGGVGKTRLSIQVIAEVLELFPDGVWFLDLAPLNDPLLVPNTLANVLGLRESGELSVADLLVNYFRSRTALVIFDNCEHLIESCAQLANSLLTSCGGLAVLATSREVLRVSGEIPYRVPSLELPVLDTKSTIDILKNVESIRLFGERARVVRPDFAIDSQNALAIAQICQRLDGIPLAIELAAARINVLTVEQISKRLNDRFNLLTRGSRTALPRHQALRAAIDWSYDLLSEKEGLLFKRLAVFIGGWVLEAAESVCSGDSIESAEILELLEHLINKSIVVAQEVDHETRYRLLETIREYARERLEESGQAETIRQRHAEFFLHLAEYAPNPTTREARKALYTRFDREQDNFRIAMTWALNSRHVELGLRLVGALGDYWFWWACRYYEGWSWISQFLALPESTQSKHARANALKAALNLLLIQGENAEADRLADEGLALFRELSDKTGMAWVLVSKGWNLRNKSTNEAEPLIYDSLVLFREIVDQRGIGMALWLLSAFREEQGSPSEAIGMLEEGITALQVVGDDALAGQLYTSLGDLYFNSSDIARAIELLSQAVTLCREGGDEDGACNALINLAWASLVQGDIERAASQLEESEAWYRQFQLPTRLVNLLSELGYVRHLQGDEDAATALFHEAMILYQQQQRTWGLIKSLELCAWRFADLHQPQRAAWLFGVAEAGREQIGARLQHMKSLHDRHVEQTRADLDESAFDTAWSEGRTLTTEQAIALALGNIDEM